MTSTVLAAVESGTIAGLSMTVTLAELLTVPAKAGDQRTMHDYELYLTRFPNLRLLPLDADLARETAVARAATGLRMPDAVQVAAARLTAASAIVTNDQHRERQVTRPALLILDEFVELGSIG